MKHLIGFGLIAYLLISTLPAAAQTATPTPVPYVFTQGYYEFESHVASMTYSGSWSTSAFSPSITYRIGTAGSTVSLWVRGKYLLVYRAVDPAFWGGSNDVCIGATCSNFGAYHSAFTIEPFVVVLPDNVSNYEVVISSVSYTSYLDSFMILDEPSLSLPTPTPITFPPSPTPINTPIDTPTAAPSVTPIGLIWAIDPAARYGMLDGQITAQQYSLRAGDYITIALLVIVVLTGLVQIGVSLWKD